MIHIEKYIIKKMDIPNNFKERYSSIISDFNILSEPLPKSFRVNTIKTTIKEIKERFKKYNINIKRLDFYKEAFISESPEIGKTLEHFLGYIYSQEITSMLPPLTILTELKEANLILDACAAPGSKTTQLATLTNGTIIANDLDYQRIKALKHNIEKTGAINTIITNQDLRRIKDIEPDIILLDAPCSAEGTTRKNPEVFNYWSIKDILKHSNLQKQLILKSYELLKPKGILIYSTCTFAPEENEEVINYLLNKTNAKLEKINLNLKTREGILNFNNKEYNKEIKKCIRIIPEDNNSGGFFIAKIKKC